jgi:hypothetical protein
MERDCEINEYDKLMTYQGISQAMYKFMNDVDHLFRFGQSNDQDMVNSLVNKVMNNFSVDLDFFVINTISVVNLNNFSDVKLFYLFDATHTYAGYSFHQVGNIIVDNIVKRNGKPHIAHLTCAQIENSRINNVSNNQPPQIDILVFGNFDITWRRESDGVWRIVQMSLSDDRIYQETPIFTLVYQKNYN